MTRHRDLFNRLIVLENLFVSSLWKVIFNTSSELHRDTEQERLALFVSELGKYFLPVQVTLRNANNWKNKLASFVHRLGHLIGQERMLITTDSILEASWDQIRFDWASITSAHSSAEYAFRGKFPFEHERKLILTSTRAFLHLGTYHQSSRVHGETHKERLIQLDLGRHACTDVGIGI